jgi:hypothetical protein
MCTWFGWYVQTGTTVPSAPEFDGLFLSYGLSYCVARSAFRHAAASSYSEARSNGAQTEEEVVRKTAAAAACHVAIARPATA